MTIGIITMFILGFSTGLIVSALPYLLGPKL